MHVLYITLQIAQQGQCKHSADSTALYSTELNYAHKTYKGHKNMRGEKFKSD